MDARGRYRVDPLSTNTLYGGGPSGAWTTWDVTSVAQQWANGTTQNDGVLFKLGRSGGMAPAACQRSCGGGGSSLVTFSGPGGGSAPYLAVTYLPGAGDSGFYTFYKHQIDDQMGLAVNVANGNLMVNAKDVSMPGVGLPLSIDRTYNSLAPALSDLGNGWTMSTGRDVSLQPLADGDVILHDGTGYEAWFQAQPYNQTNPFLSPPGVDATLTGSTSAGFTLTMNQTQ